MIPPQGDTITNLARLLATMPNPAGTTHTTALEHDLASRFGVRHAVTVSSGTAALHTALAALTIGPGDEVLVPALSVVMSVAPVVHTAARPVFVDCNPDGTDFDYDDLTAKITDATTAILPVHLWGRTGDLPRLARLATDRGLHLIEDACQAQGTRIDGQHAGTLGAVGCFSLKDGKILWSGEGGYLLTDNDDIARRSRALRSHWQPSHAGNDPPQLGHNYRLAEPLALIAHANLARFDTLLAHRQHQAQLLGELLHPTPGIQVINAPNQSWNGYAFLATISLPDPRAFSTRLARLGVPNSVGSYQLVPTDRRPAFAAHSGNPCRNAAAVIDRALAVVLTDHDDDRRVADYAHSIRREANRWRPT